MTRQSIGLLGLGKRTYNLLAKAGLMYVDQLQQTTDQELCVIPGFGATALADVRRTLAKYESKKDERHAVTT